MVIRLAAALCALAILLGAARAHEGHEHAPDQVPAATSGAPRAEGHSATFELVALARGSALVLYLDDSRSNAPVSRAQLNLDTTDGEVAARLQPDGTYVVDAPWLTQGGHRELAVTVTVGGVSETIGLDLDLPDPAPPRATSESRAGSSFALVAEIRAHLAHQAPVGAAAGGFFLGLATIMLRRSRMTMSFVLLLALTVMLLASGAALAHDGEHAAMPIEEPALTQPPTLFERSRREADGSVFVPKATQRLLSIRTAVTSPTQHRRMVELPGRVIADPNTSGVVQSSVGGRLAPPPGGFPELGTRVRTGDRLAMVTPPVQTVDLSDMRQTQGDLDQQIAIVERRVVRYEKLAVSGAVAQTVLDDARAELNGLKDRRAAIDTIRRQPEALTAPVDGVISERAAIAGQMAAPGTMVFRIADPDRLYVEALSFDALDPHAQATARLPDGRALALTYRGSGLVDRNQAVPIQYAVRGGDGGLRIGQFVTVLSPTGPAREGLTLPRASVVRSEGGSIVYEHVSAERFASRPVRIEPLDAQTVLVAGGLTAGQRIVTEGADLIDQVR